MNEKNVLLHHQKLLFDENTPSKLSKERQLTAHIYNAACAFEDNRTTCNLLSKHLNNYSKLFQQKAGVYNQQVQELLAKSNRKINKTKIDLPGDPVSLLKPLSCSNNPIKCRESENQLKQAFKRENSLENVFHKQPAPQEPEVKATSSKEKTVKYPSNFKTAREELQMQSSKKNSGNQQSFGSNMATKKKLGTRRNINSKFVSPLLSNPGSFEEIKNEEEWSLEVDERLKNVDPKMVELIKSEIMDCGPGIHWDDIAGLKGAKTAIQEAVVWPMLRPDIFTGLRRPPKGILLFGPPGTGKTLIGKCVASQSKSTFFSISASSLTSKWVGDGEKMVRALFIVARVHQPAVIFIDEIDSLLSQRSDTEHESSRRIKTEFLVQLDGATTESEERILVIGATNRPQELDEAARRRFVKRLYIPLPDYSARLQLVQKLIMQEQHELTQGNFESIAQRSDGYSGADIRTLCSEASLGPIRSIDMSLIEKIEAADVRPLMMEDFEKAFKIVRSSVSPNDLQQYVVWDGTYGSGSCR